MKYFAILFYALWAKNSFATECCSNNTVNLPSLLSNYQKFVNNITAPTVQCGNQSANQFKHTSAQAIQDYGVDLLTNIQNQAKYLGDELIDDIQRDYDRLKRAIKLISKSHTKPIALKMAVKRLTDQCWKFLKLGPGNATINRQLLPDVPAQPIPLKTVETELTAEDIFVNGAANIFDASLQVYAYWTYIYRTVLLESLPLYELIRSQINDEILNCSVMGAYRRIVIKIFGKACLIRSHVPPKIWKNFKDAGGRILDISNAYCKALKAGEDLSTGTTPRSNDTHGDHQIVT